MLLNDFFKITEIANIAEGFTATVELNPAHSIFNGHFPGNPIVPGVCLVEMVKETLAYNLKRDLALMNSDNIKFLSIVNPLENNILKIDFKTRTLDEGIFQTKVIMYNGEEICLKFDGKFK
jgi:3-hydroxymyristoyl/3-hydroxydecanoyl-(acyl carrier protein) dehydratases